MAFIPVTGIRREGCRKTESFFCQFLEPTVFQIGKVSRPVLYHESNPVKSVFETRPRDLMSQAHGRLCMALLAQSGQLFSVAWSLVVFGAEAGSGIDEIKWAGEREPRRVPHGQGQF